MTGFLHLALLILALLAWRFLVLWFRPMRSHRRCDGRGCPRCRQSGTVRRLGGKQVARLRLTAHQALSDQFAQWFSRDSS